MSKKDYYEILGISKSASEDEIKSAFRKSAKKYHPDVSKEPDSDKKFKEAQEAYSVLSDPQKKSKYDQFGHSAFDQSSGYGSSGAGFGGFSSDNFDYSDIFGSIFEGFGFGGSSGSSRNRPSKGDDIQIIFEMSFEEAAFGTSTTVPIEITDNCDKCDGKGGTGSKTCHECSGSGYINQQQRSILGSFVTRATCPTCEGEGQTYSKVCTKCNGKKKINTKKELIVKVPKGVDTGDHLRLPGKGPAGDNGGPNGDVYIEIRVKPHPIYKREKDDLIISLPITVAEAALGIKKDVPTLNGKIVLNIPAGAQTNDRHRVRLKGLQNPNTKRTGDLYVVIKVITPQKLNKSQKKLFQELSKTNLNTEEMNKFNKFL